MELEQIKDIARSDIDITDNIAYFNVNGQIPRVTQIISKMIHEDAIVQWSNSLGFKHKSYTQVLKEAAEYGTYTHEGIESFLKQTPLKDETPLIPIEAFKAWWTTLNLNNQVRILGQEQRLTCPYFGGTYDLLLSINNKIFLVDFKTSNHVTYKYYIQLSAYSYLLKHLQNIHINGVIILQLDKKEPKYTEYRLDLSNPIHRHYFDICERTFLSLVYAYYHITYLEEGFKNELQSKKINNKRKKNR